MEKAFVVYCASLTDVERVKHEALEHGWRFLQAVDVSRGVLLRFEREEDPEPRRTADAPDDIR